MVSKENKYILTSEFESHQVPYSFGHVTHRCKKPRKLLQCNPDIRYPDIREIFSGPKLEPVLPKQNRPKPDIRDFSSGPDNSLISGLHCT